MKFARLKDQYDKENYINVERVNFVRQYDETTTEINFGDKESNVYVKMPASAVVSALGSAGKF